MLSTSPGVFAEPERVLGGLGKGLFRVVDVRPFSKYVRAHIPGSLWIYFWDFTQHEKGMPTKPKPVEEIAASLGRAGLSREDRVVIAFDRMSIGIASYTYWYLEYMGQEEVSLLRGGLEEWEARGMPLERGPPKASPRSYIPRPRPELRASLEEVVKISRGEEEGLLLDVRTPEEHVGRVSSTPRPGRIPGSVLAPPELFLQALLGDQAAASMVKEILARPGGSRAVAYCTSGERASLAWLVLRKILGVEGARLYPESFYEYSSKKDLPVETG